MASVTKTKPLTRQDFRAINAAVEQRAPAGEGLFASAAPTRGLWTSFWDTVEQRVEIELYLKEQTRDGVVTIDRPEPLTFALA